MAALVDQGDCALLSAPPEIRNHIYEFVLRIQAAGGNSAIEIAKRPRSGNNASTYSVQTILQTCKQIYNEAADTFYAVNTIRLPNRQVKTFIDAMSVPRLSFITTIAIHDSWSKSGDLKLVEYLTALPRLQFLSIAFTTGSRMHLSRATRAQQLVQIQKDVSKMPQLRQVRITTNYYGDEDLVRALEEAMNRAIFGGRARRAIEEAWAAGVVLLKTRNNDMKHCLENSVATSCLPSS